ncbi:MAG: hypothetical protein H7A40_07280 [Chlamydiales bacterium]|nr:hypothetical protein [Chlamydiales bacterium]
MKIYRGLTITVAIGDTLSLSREFAHAQPFNGSKEAGSTSELKKIEARIDEQVVVVFGNFCNGVAYNEEIGIIKKIKSTRIIGICDYRQKPEDIEVTNHVNTFAGPVDYPLISKLIKPTILHLEPPFEKANWKVIKSFTTLKCLRVAEGCGLTGRDLLSIVKANSGLRSLHVAVSLDHNIASEFVSHFFNSQIRIASGLTFPKTIGPSLSPLRDNPKKFMEFTITQSNGCKIPEEYQALSSGDPKYIEDLVILGSIAIIKKQYDYLDDVLQWGVDVEAVCETAFLFQDLKAIKVLVQNGLKFDECIDLCVEALDMEQVDFVKAVLKLMIKNGLCLKPSEIRSYNRQGRNQGLMTLYQEIAPKVEKPTASRSLEEEIEALKKRIEALEIKVDSLSNKG